MRAPADSRPPSHPPRFLIRPDGVAGDRVRLDAAEARHAHVRRLAAGDTVALFDGGGHSWIGVIETWSRAGVDVRLTEQRPDREAESGLDLTLAVAVLKADKLDWLIEKVTELGVSRIRPFVSRHSLARPSAARLTRWQQIAVSAAKQCGRSVVPPVDAPLAFDAVLQDPAPGRLICWEGRASEVPGDAPLSAPNAAAVVVVGPEGGFAPDEVEAAHTAGFHILSLGPRILRAETAAVTAVALCQQRWGDLSPRSTD